MKGYIKMFSVEDRVMLVKTSAVEYVSKGMHGDFKVHLSSGKSFDVPKFSFEEFQALVEQ